MNKVIIEVDLRDEDGLLAVSNMLSGYLNGLRVKAAKDKYHVLKVTPETPPDSDPEAVTEAPETPVPQHAGTAEDPLDPRDPLYDSEDYALGVKYDPELHSSGKTKLQDGSWRMKANRSTRQDDSTGSDAGSGTAPPPPSETKSEKPIPPPPADTKNQLTPGEGAFKQLMDDLRGLKMDGAAMNELAKAAGLSTIYLAASDANKIAEIRRLAFPK